MASPRPWPFDDDDRPSGSVRPLSQADLQAILAHLSHDPDELLAGTSADRPVVAMRVRASVGRPGGSAQARLAADFGRPSGPSGSGLCPGGWPSSLVSALAAGFLGSLLAPRLEPGGRRAGGQRGRLGAAVPAQPGGRRLAAGGGGGAANCSAAWSAGAAGVGGPA